MEICIRIIWRDTYRLLQNFDCFFVLAGSSVYTSQPGVGSGVIRFEGDCLFKGFYSFVLLARFLILDTLYCKMLKHLPLATSSIPLILS